MVHTLASSAGSILLATATLNYCFAARQKQTGPLTSPAVTAYPYDAKQRIEPLTSTLTRHVVRDPDQEIQAVAVSDRRGDVCCSESGGT